MDPQKNQGRACARILDYNAVDMLFGSLIAN
jgi:hypothetical protein